jgi:hypothetical protein
MRYFGLMVKQSLRSIFLPFPSLPYFELVVYSILFCSRLFPKVSHPVMARASGPGGCFANLFAVVMVPFIFETEFVNSNVPSMKR